MSPGSTGAGRPLRVAVAGNPNVGKTSLFNELTGSRYQVGNYPGVTVEIREGRVVGRHQPPLPMELVDLPGTYSLTPTSEDEAIALRTLLGRRGPAPDAVLLVVDASNLARNLYLVRQALELRLPAVVALNMVDTAEAAGVSVSAEELSRALGVPVVPTVGRTGRGARALVDALAAARPAPAPELAADDPPLVRALAQVSDPGRARLLAVCAAAGVVDEAEPTTEECSILAENTPAETLTAAEVIIAGRYAAIEETLEGLGSARSSRERAPAMDASRRVDRVLTHPLWGMAIFAGLMAFVFTSIFRWAEPVMTLVEDGMASLSGAVARALGPGLLTDLLTDGIIAGAGNVVVFVPQIALLFLFLGLMEDSGYLARAAFLMDRIMARVGLHGRAFVPLMSGYACAIPAILGTRTITSFRDRMVAILMIPYMSCSARLPVYLLVVYALFQADRPVLGPLTEGSLVVLGMYLLSTVSALVAGAIYKRTILRGPTPPLVLELPPYRLPRLRNTLLVVYDRSMDFVRSAGTVILAFTIVLWALLSFPRAETGAGTGGPTRISHSYAGRAAKVIEPALEPMGQDWRMGVGIIGSFAAREVLVSTLGLVYGLEGAGEDPVPLRQAIREDRDPATGKPRHTRASGLALMVFFVYACQCMSTLAVVRRETRSWRWPAFMFVSMTLVAYVAAVATYWLARSWGWG